MIVKFRLFKEPTFNQFELEQSVYAIAQLRCFCENSLKNFPLFIIFIVTFCRPKEGPIVDRYKQYKTRTRKDNFGYILSYIQQIEIEFCGISRGGGRFRRFVCNFLFFNQLKKPEVGVPSTSMHCKT